MTRPSQRAASSAWAAAAPASGTSSTATPMTRRRSREVCVIARIGASFRETTDRQEPHRHAFSCPEHLSSAIEQPAAQVLRPGADTTGVREGSAERLLERWRPYD